MDQQAMELLAKISQTQTEMRNEIIMLRNDVTMLRNDTTMLRADQGTIVQNVAKIENDITILRADQGTMAQNVAKIENDVTILRNDVTILRNDVTILRTDQETLAQNVSKIEMVLEHKVAPKISALFDFRELQMDHNQKTDKSLERIEAKIEDLQLETSNLRRIK